MPELPEVETVVRELNRKLVGRKIARVEVRHPKIVAIGPDTLPPKRTTSTTIAEEFSRELRDKKVLSVSRRSKVIIIELSSHDYVLVHLKMTGQFIFEDADQRKKTGSRYRLLNKLSAPLVLLPSAHTHVIFYFTDKSTLYFNDTRRFGYMKLVTHTQLEELKEFKEYGPEPLSRQFSARVLEKRIATRKKTSIKQALMDNTVVVGIGNIYSDEILFHAGVRPDRLVGTVTPTELRKIYDHIRPILKRGIAAKGSSVGDFVRTDGTWGTMGKYHYVYGRGKRDCLSCTTTLISKKIGGRTTTFCPHCQI